ncbi:Transposase IS66 family protein [Rhodospira trueperi]|uniref:Transposase IS66 family protein n=1 Tax=Rhodospira trueperi TaxID=69960 RepID=A0A1G7I1W1_9PROT|nr:Transposase IS66 family protein [Rhodospira trueperi]
MATLRPLIERIKAEALAADRLHADDTPIRVLDPGRRTATGGEPGVKEGRIWAYVHDDRPWGGTDPPAVAYVFSPDRKGEHPQRHLAGFRGILQADAYAGFRKLYEARDGAAPRVREAACWAHLRRDFHDVWKATDSPIAREALEQIGALYDIERRITGLSAEQRLAVRQAESRPRVEAFHAWCEAQLPRIPGKSDLAKAMRYALGRWPAFTLFLENGEPAFAPALRRLLRWAVAIGRRRDNLKDSTLRSYHAKAERQLDKVLAIPVTTEAGRALLAQTKRWRGSFFTFLRDRDVPPTNNGSERALRPSVIFRKVTNGFRSAWSAQTHARTRSVIGTGRLNDIPAHQAISRTLAGQTLAAA